MATRKPERRAAGRRLEYIIIEGVSPEIDGGRYPAKRIVGDVVSVGADLIKEGHDKLAAWLLYKGPDDGEWTSVPMTYDVPTDRWYAEFRAERIGRWTFTVEAATDRFITWRSELVTKVAAGSDVSSELSEGAVMARTAAGSTKFGAARAALLNTAKVLEDRRDTSIEKRINRALDEDFLTLMQEYLRPTDLTRYRHELTVIVDRERARFSSWYEMFPRSQVPAGETRHGTFADAALRLPRIAELGFDVVYLPPIHPVGRTFRKGKNNSLSPEPDDVGSPWAIGNEQGGHMAVEPALGTIDDFDLFVQEAQRHHLEIALDYALQCSPDHPWVKEHPEWFHVRPDGTIKYAENPPKKYQDIYPINFWCEDREGLWNACRDVLLYWIEHGVKIFRVDNPHTKAFAFWEWVIEEVQRDHPDVLFFAEAFTRPKRMKSLAKLGFTMSYTYFTWKNEEWDLREYFEELNETEMAEYYRGNLFPNTPDILNEFLVEGGLPAFRIRLLLATTLSPLYGIYSGFELGENVPVKEGSEEYLNSEKYEIRPRDYEAPGNLNADIQLLNAIRRAQPALQHYANLSFHKTENEQILFFMKSGRVPQVHHVCGETVDVPPEIVEQFDLDAEQPGADRAHDLLVVVTLDPHRVQETMVHVPLEALGLDEEEPYVVQDLLTGARYTWRGPRNYVRLDPAHQPGHLLLVERS